MNRKNNVATVAERSVISVHTKKETAKRLDTLATLTRRSKSFLANEAIERYLKEEEDFVQSVKRGKADITAGRTHTTDQMRAQLKSFVTKKASS